MSLFFSYLVVFTLTCRESVSKYKAREIPHILNYFMGFFHKLLNVTCYTENVYIPRDKINFNDAANLKDTKAKYRVKYGRNNLSDNENS